MFSHHNGTSAGCTTHTAVSPLVASAGYYPQHGIAAESWDNIPMLSAHFRGRHRNVIPRSLVVSIGQLTSGTGERNHTNGTTVRPSADSETAQCSHPRSSPGFTARTAHTENFLKNSLAFKRGSGHTPLDSHLPKAGASPKCALEWARIHRRIDRRAILPPFYFLTGGPV